MNLIQVKEEPKTIVGFVSPPEDIDTEEKEIQWLRNMLNQGALNLHLPNSWLQTVKAVYELALSKKYKIMVKALPLEPGQTSSASAEFFFQVTP